MTNYQPLKNLHSRLLLISLVFVIYISYDLYIYTVNKQTVLAIFNTLFMVYGVSQIIFASKQIHEIDKLEKHEHNVRNLTQYNRE